MLFLWYPEFMAQWWKQNVESCTAHVCSLALGSMPLDRIDHFGLRWLPVFLISASWAMVAWDLLIISLYYIMSGLKNRSILQVPPSPEMERRRTLTFHKPHKYVDFVLGTGTSLTLALQLSWWGSGMIYKSVLAVFLFGSSTGLRYLFQQNND